ncbi:Tryptophan--tRNA ligase, mitochondrial [Aphelenchoides bicaudatus]|nr:Tryptophan--tRNA ligase, mitochondrial [Aphelenchoides bicaudatus]
MIFRRLCSTTANAASQIQANSRIISGIQPTGIPHIGNYLGFIDNFVRLQNEHDSAQKFLFLADYHSISVGLPKIGELDQNVRQMTACLLACGVDPKRTIYFAQSQILEHTEFSWILSSMQSIARLQRLTQFKDKAGRYSTANVPLGLISYPLLQVGDVLLYKGTHVPVGEDQTQHFNLIGGFARKINNRINEEFFPIPVMLTSNYPRIKSLRNPAQKMSKSDASKYSCVFITDSADTIREKIRRAFTDDCKFCLRSHIRTLKKLWRIANHWTLWGLKDRTADVLIAHFEPIRTKYEKIIEEPSFIVETLANGREKAHKIAQENMLHLKERLGFYTGK